MSKRKAEEVSNSYETWYGRGEAEFSCIYNDCLICTYEQDAFHSKNPTWSNILWVVFRCLQNHEPERSFFSLKDDVYPFIWLPAHWDKLCKEKEENDNKQRNVKKKIQDALSHNHKTFESGACKYKQNVFWRLRERGSAVPAEKRKSSEDSSGFDEEKLDNSVALFRKEMKERLDAMRAEIERLKDEILVLNSFNSSESFDKLRLATHALIDRLREQLYGGIEASMIQECFSPAQFRLIEEMEKTKRYY